MTSLAMNTKMIDQLVHAVGDSHYKKYGIGCVRIPYGLRVYDDWKSVNVFCRFDDPNELMDALRKGIADLKQQWKNGNFSHLKPVDASPQKVRFI